MKLAHRVAIVTGAAHGIGRAIAQRFAREGAQVVAADIDETAGEAVVRDLSAGGAQAHFVRCDVGDRAQAEDLIAAAVRHAGRLDILVNNAGIGHRAEFLDLEEADFDRVLRVNLKGPFVLGQAAARQMVRQGQGGAIVNVSSINAVVAIPNQVPYVVSKGGLNQLTKVMALSLAAHGIRVNGIGPGSILTDLLRTTVMQDDVARRRILSRTPLGRCGEPEEIASIAAFLASDEASYLTGQTLYADGGRLALNLTVPAPE